MEVRAIFTKVMSNKFSKRKELQYLIKDIVIVSIKELGTVFNTGNRNNI